VSLSVTSITRVTGVNCNHFVVTVDHEGISYTQRVQDADLDNLPDGEAELTKQLVLIWAKYRRNKGRAIVGTIIA